MTTYRVTLSFQFPAWDEVNGIPFYVEAGSKAEAVERARREARRDGHTPATGKGRASFRAELDA
jgi:hypothetical protein